MSFCVNKAKTNLTASFGKQRSTDLRFDY